MRSRIDRQISRRLQKDIPPMPSIENSKIDQLLCRVREEDAQSDEKTEHIFPYRRVAVALGAALILTTGTYAAVDQYREHLKSMSLEEKKHLNSMTQMQSEDADHYSRKLSTKELKRKEQLQVQYKEGTLPQKKLKEINSLKEIAEYRNSVVYCRSNSTFYLPNSELSDEQLLQIIDFCERREYALEQQNKDDIAEAQKEVVDNETNKLTKKQAIQMAKQYVGKIYNIDTDDVKAEVDMTAYEDDEYTVLISQKSWKCGYRLLLDGKTGALHQIDEDIITYMSPLKKPDMIQNMQKKHISIIRKMTNTLENGAQIVKCKAIYAYDKDVKELGAVLKYFVQSSSGKVYVYSYNVDNNRVDGLWITSDFEEAWETEVHQKKERSKKDDMQIKYFNCIE